MTEETTYLYAIKCGPFYKIGVAFSPKARLRSLQCGNPLKLTLAFTAEVERCVAYPAENQVHKKLAAHHHQDEWFRCRISLIRQAIKYAVQKRYVDSGHRLRRRRAMTPEIAAALERVAERNRAAA